MLDVVFHIFFWYMQAPLDQHKSSDMSKFWSVSDTRQEGKDPAHYLF